MKALSTLFVVMGALSGLGGALGLLLVVRARGGSDVGMGLYLLIGGALGAILWFGLSAALNAIARIEEMVTEMRGAMLRTAPPAPRAPAPPSDRMSETTG